MFPIKFRRAARTGPARGRGVKSSAQRHRAVQFAIEAMEQRCLLSGATIGMNLDGISDDSTIGAFNDLAKMFRPWGQVATPYQPDSSIPVTAQDYPLADAGAITYATAYPDGIYQVSYDGVGDVSFSGLGHAIFNITSHVNDHWTGTLDLAHDENGGGILELYIKNIDQADPIHNLHIISPDANPEISPTFRPVFLDKLKDWNGTLRFMDWEQTNSNPQVNWSDRTQVDRFSYVSDSGVPLETIIELANLTRKDIWINTPFNANDDFIKNMADLFRDELNPSLKVFVENSNELWNFQFQQTIDLLHATQADNDPLFTGSDDFGRMAQEAAKRMVNVSSQFRQEFGAARFDAQVRPVFGSFIAVPYWAQQGMDYIARRYGSPRDYIYGLAVAPYVGTEGDIASIDNDSLTMQALFDSMNSFIDTNIMLWLQQHKALCDQYGLKLEAYEGGQSLQAQNGMNEALKVAAQSDPLMGQMYQHLINVWEAAGGDIFNNFSLSNHYSINGYWGLLDRIDETTSTKWEAVHSMLPQGGPLPAAQVSVSSGLVGKRGDVVHAYISIDDAAGLSSIDLALNYNTAELDLSNADVTLTGVLGSDWTLVPNVNDATGKLTLTAYTSDVQPTGGGQMIDIAFHVRSDAAAAALVLDLDDGGSPARSRLNEGQMEANFIDGSLTVPVAAAITGAPPTDPEGTAIALGATTQGANGAVTYLWHVSASNGQAIADSTDPNFTFTPVDDGTYVVSLSVLDANGISGGDSKSILVTNVAPTASIVGTPANAPEGSLVHLTSLVSDAGSVDTFTYAWTVTKDGQAYGSSTSPDFTFTPDLSGSYVIQLVVSDDDGGITTDAKTVEVTAVAPTVAIAGAPASAPEGTPIHLDSMVTFAGAVQAVTYAWTILKNGTPYAAGTGDSIDFTPDDDGIYAVNLTVTDAEGVEGLDAATITVTNVAPSASIVGAPATSPEGTEIVLTSMVSDAGSADTFSYAWMVTKNGNAYSSGTSAAFTFTPDDDGSYVVMLTVTDDDGGVGNDVQTVSVINVDPNATIIGAPTNSPEGTPIALTSSVSDAGSADTQTYAWTVTKNGSAYASASTEGFSFTPDDNGDYVVTLVVTDDDGGIGTDSKTIDVTNVNPTATISGAPAASPEGTAISLSGATSDAGSADTQTFAWAVTKNGDAYTSGTGAAFTFTPDDNGTFVVTLTVTDNDGGMGTDSATISVTNVAPLPAIHGAPATAPEGEAINLTGSASDAGSADTIAFDWTVTRDGNAFASGSGAGFTFTPDSTGDYVVTLRAVDDDGGENSVSTTITATFVTFRVTALTPTDSGFDFSFNRAVNFGALNVYASADGVHGAADVTVTGAITGPVHGSLVYDAGRGVYSFVKTGGPLLPDTYTVTLAAQADGNDGWRDLSGGALDGNGDGTAGDSYTSTFTINAAPQRVVTLSDFSRGPGQVVNVPNTAVGLPVSINDSTDLFSVVMTMTFDPSLLNITDVSGPEGWNSSLSQDGPGQVTITASGPALANGITDLFHLTATVPSAASYGATDLIRITQLMLNGGAIGGHGDAAIHEVAYLGDVTGNQQYSGMDAMYIARVAAGLDDGFSAYDRVDPRIIGDITGDGSLSGLDSHYVARKAVGLDVAQIPDIPAAPATPAAAAIAMFDLPAGVMLSLPAGLVAKPGATIHVPVNISDYGDIGSLDLTILYDTSLLDLSNGDVTLGQAGAGWTLVQNANDSIGKLRLTLYRAQTMDGGPGEMIDLAFHIPLAAPSGAPAVSLAGDVDEGAVPLTGGSGTLQIDAVAPTVASAVFDPNGGAHQLTVKFSEDVGASLSLGDLIVTNTTSGQTIGGGAMMLIYDPATFTAVITFPGLPGGILPDGDYRLTIAAAGVSDLAGNQLDGQSNGTAGVDYSLAFYQLLGDLNRDHVVNQADRTILTGAMTGGTVILAKDGDTNGDHQVNFADLVAVAQHYGQSAGSTAAGDVNGDGAVNFADLVAVAQHYGRDGRGDLNVDGLINQADLDLLDGILNPAPVGAGLPVEAAVGSFDTAAVMTAPVAAATPASPALVPVPASSVAVFQTAATANVFTSARTPAPVAKVAPVVNAAPMVKHIARTRGAGHLRESAGKRQTVGLAPVLSFNASRRIKQNWLESAD